MLKFSPPVRLRAPAARTEVYLVRYDICVDRRAKNTRPPAR